MLNNIQHTSYCNKTSIRVHRLFNPYATKYAVCIAVYSLHYTLHIVSENFVIHIVHTLLISAGT